MENISKSKKALIIAILVIVILITGSIFIVSKVKESSKIDIANNIKTASDDEIWCATFQIAWKELTDKLNLSKIEFEDEENEFVNKLNSTKFGLNSISNDNYYLFVDDYDINTTKANINAGLKQKFNKTSNTLDNLNLEDLDGKIIYSYLEKNYTFEKSFDVKNDMTFTTNTGNQIKVKGFGIDSESDENILKNIKEAYFCDDFAYSYGICLNTQEEEEIIFVMPQNIDEDFETIWQEYQTNKEKYKSEVTLDTPVRIPYINVDGFFNYDELCGKIIKDTDAEYISNAIQNIKFSLDEAGGKLENEMVLKTGTMGLHEEFYTFNSPFVMFIKEKDKEEPYFALKIYDETFLTVSEN